MYNNRVKYTDEFLKDYIMDLACTGVLDDNIVFKHHPELYNALRNSMTRHNINNMTTEEYLYSHVVNGTEYIPPNIMYKIYKCIEKYGTLDKNIIRYLERDIYDVLRATANKHNMRYEEWIKTSEHLKPYLTAERQPIMREMDYTMQVLFDSIILGQQQLITPQEQVVLMEYISQTGTFDGIEEVYPAVLNKILDKVLPFGGILDRNATMNYYVTHKHRYSKSDLSKLDYGYAKECLYALVLKIPCEYLRPSILFELRNHYDRFGHFCFLNRFNEDLYLKLLSISMKTGKSIKELINIGGLSYTPMKLDKHFAFGVYGQYIGIRSANSDSIYVNDEVLFLDIPTYNKLHPYLDSLRFEYRLFRGKEQPVALIRLKGSKSAKELQVYELIGSNIDFRDKSPINLLPANIVA